MLQILNNRFYLIVKKFTYYYYFVHDLCGFLNHYYFLPPHCTRTHGVVETWGPLDVWIRTYSVSEDPEFKKREQLWGGGVLLGCTVRRRGSGDT
jgi:hypothetical protein